MTEKLTLETAIAHRAFEVAGRPSETVDVFIGKPFQMPEGEWACPYRIVGAGEDICFQIYGIDSVQALQLVWKVIDANKKYKARVEAIEYILNKIPYGVKNKRILKHQNLEDEA